MMYPTYKQESSLQFATMLEAKSMLETFFNSTHTHRSIPIEYKKAVLNFCAEKRKSYSDMCITLKISPSSIATWKNQIARHDGEIVTSIKKIKKLPSNLQSRLEAQKKTLTELQNQLKVVQECEALGYTVTST